VGAVLQQRSRAVRHIRSIELIGEASRHISTATLNEFPEIEWRGMREMRNHLVHGYDKVDLEQLWDTIHHDLPKLIGQLRLALGQRH
jgi:uncharacterized protein with HEPN domain